MNLAWTVEYAVQTGRARIVLLEWLFPQTGLRATESDIFCCVFGVITIIATLVFIASGLAVAISGSEVPRLLALLLLQANQLSLPAQKRAMSVVRAAMDFGFS